jgi:type II restriction enzyme
MMRAISTDAAPNYYFMHYDVVTWRVRNLLLVPHFAFPPSAIVKRPPLAATARRAGWVGCNFDLDRIPVDARIPIVSTIKTSGIGKGRAVSPLTAEKYVEMRPARDCGPCLNETVITPPEKVRESFRRAKTLKDVPERGWVLDVLNIVRRITGKRGPQETAGPTFTNADVYAFERELAQLHPENRHIRDKIRQQLQVLRDTGFLTQPERGVWRIK